MTRWEHPAILSEAQPFRGLPLEALEDVWRSGEAVAGAAREPLFRQGDDAGRCFVLLSGCVKMVQVTEEGAEVVLGFIHPGQLFGCLGAFEDTIYPATAVCVEPSRAVGWPRGTWRNLSLRYPQMSMNMAAVLGGRLHSSRERMAEMATKGSAQRIAAALLRLTRSEGHGGEDGGDGAPAGDVKAATLKWLHVSRQDLASMTGTGLYTVSRTLQDWARQGLVDVGRERVAVRDAAALEAIARGEAV